MGMGLFIGFIILLIFLSMGIGLLIYSRKKKSKIGLTISIIMLSLVGLVLLTNTIDEISISKKDIVSDLSHINIELKDDFKIVNNKVTGMPDRMQETEIQISQRDKDRIISEIKNSSNFKSFTNGHSYRDDDMGQFVISDKVFNFKYPEFYSKETYTRIDNFPTIITISIYDESNIIKYQRIEN